MVCQHKVRMTNTALRVACGPLGMPLVSSTQKCANPTLLVACTSQRMRLLLKKLVASVLLVCPTSSHCRTSQWAPYTCSVQASPHATSVLASSRVCLCTARHKYLLGGSHLLVACTDISAPLVGFLLVACPLSCMPLIATRYLSSTHYMHL